MTPFEATRTLVKSPPEVWAQCSDAGALERHLDGSFGEIRITRLEPETTVAWEGERVRGTVRIEPSAWGTRVTMTARLEQDGSPTAQGPADGPPAPLAPDTTPVSPGAAQGASGAEEGERDKPLWTRLVFRFRANRSISLERRPGLYQPPSGPPQAPSGLHQPPAEPPPDQPARPDPVEILRAALDSLGQAHHRPYSRG